MDDIQAGRINRAREVLAEDQHPVPGRDTGELIHDLSSRIGKLEYWLRDMIDLAAAELGQPPTPLPGLEPAEAGPAASLASCGHPADPDGECSCSSWPERAPVPPPAVMDAYREATGQPAAAHPRYISPGACFGPDCEHRSHHWSPPPALDGYAYILPEDYLRGGAQ